MLSKLQRMPIPPAWRFYSLICSTYRELETILHCRIATTLDLALLRRTVHHPEEQIASYRPLVAPFETPLYQRLRAQFDQLEIMSKYFRYAKEATSELGAWCADQLWRFLLAEEEAPKLESRVEREFLAQKHNTGSVEVLNADIAQLRQAIDLVKDHSYHSPRMELSDLSSKVMLLHSYLLQRFDKPTDDKCIIFVKKRYTTRVLGDLFGRLGIPNIRVGTLLGARQGDPGEPNITYKQQMVTMKRFRKGALNCLVSSMISSKNADNRANPIASLRRQLPRRAWTYLIAILSLGSSQAL